MTTHCPEQYTADLKVFLNHIYELKKGVRHMVLYTMKQQYKTYAIQRLESQHIAYVIQPVDQSKINIFFGKDECIHAIRRLIRRRAA